MRALSASACRFRSTRSPRNRRGAVVVLAVFMLMIAMGMLALGLDVGVLLVARTELQRSADAAAIAAAWEVAQQGANSDLERLARGKAVEFAGANLIGRNSPIVAANMQNSSDGDVVMGFLPPPWDQPMRTYGVARPNAVTVRVRRTAEQNGEIPLFFAPVLGIISSEVEAEATAAFVPVMRGFRPPKTGNPDLPILPLALDIRDWEELMRGNGSDDFAWDNQTKQLTRGRDGIREVRLFPNDTAAPGNSGIVDIGSNNTHAPELRRQIAQGISPSDLDYHGGELSLDSNGELKLSGNPGLKIGVVEPPLQSIVGQSRIIPLYSEVTRQGQNATYNVVAFAGVRILEVELKGGDKRVMVQPASVIIHGGIPAEDGQGSSYFVYSPVCLVR